MVRLAARGESPASHRDRRGAPLTRRDDREYRQYLRKEQRSQRGCIAGRMQLEFHHGLLGAVRVRASRPVKQISLALGRIGWAREGTGPFSGRFKDLPYKSRLKTVLARSSDGGRSKDRPLRMRLLGQGRSRNRSRDGLKTVPGVSTYSHAAALLVSARSVRVRSNSFNNSGCSTISFRSRVMRSRHDGRRA